MNNPQNNIIMFALSIGDRVKIKGTEISGVVVGLYYSHTGKMYEVSYFYTGELKTIYLYENLLETDSDVHTTGFVL